MSELIERTRCGLLLDINNIVVTTGNLADNQAAQEYLAAIDPDWVGEIHLAGHATEQHDSGPLYIDDHGSAVSARVLQLYAAFIERAGPKPTLIEWDTDVPDYSDADGGGGQSQMPCSWRQAMFSLEAAQANFIATINHGPAALDHTLFDGPLERVLLGLKAHANTISHARLVALEESFPLTRQALGDEASINSRAHMSKRP